ncbi:hypothetical protein EKL29_10445 [Pantoea sp. YU22]|uniref:hypothetical protein n=1 Tax=Pantoea sp. YU22 TaxID=2497684 RepID=UPI000F873611|nr:hypothetical protein [Pantoea sp. YU22]RTY57988.1 hypothetical protein EKL29_10445 [Pantoea sp. YU22]
MNNLIASPKSKVSAPESKAGICISSANDTSKAALNYADQLQREFMEVLYKPMAQADVKVAGRFYSLIHELAFMVERTAANVEAGR